MREQIFLLIVLSLLLYLPSSSGHLLPRIKSKKKKTKEKNTSIKKATTKTSSGASKPQHPQTLPRTVPDKISRIYYTSHESRHDRQKFMDAWLAAQSIPFQRVASIVGQRDGCNPKKTANNPKRCERMSGLAKTGLHIMNQLNTTGMTLILQDKHALHTAQLMKLVASVPSDWDVIRFNCEGKVPDTYEYTSNNVFRTRPVPGADCSDGKCSFCGNTRAMLWRDGESVGKLRTLWGKSPIDDVDCLLSSTLVNSYCVEANVTAGSFKSSKRMITRVSEKSKSMVKYM